MKLANPGLSVDNTLSSCKSFNHYFNSAKYLVTLVYFIVYIYIYIITNDFKTSFRKIFNDIHQFFLFTKKKITSLIIFKNFMIMQY